MPTAGSVLPVALFGGTFDPIHRGHIHLASEVIGAKLAKKVIFLPAGTPWQKESSLSASALERAAMVEKAIRNSNDFELSMREVERGGPTFTIDTVRAFKAENPTEDFILILGSDAFNGITTWKDYAELLRLIDIVVAIRPGSEVLKVPGAHVKIIESAMFDISSTEIRQAARTGADLTRFVPTEIIDDVRRIYEA